MIQRRVKLGVIRLKLMSGQDFAIAGQTDRQTDGQTYAITLYDQKSIQAYKNEKQFLLLCNAEKKVYEKIIHVTYLFIYFFRFANS